MSIVVVILKNQGEPIPSKTGLDGETDDATHALRGYKEFFFLLKQWTFIGEQSRLLCRSGNDLLEQT